MPISPPTTVYVFTSNITHGDMLDAQFADHKASIESVIAALADVRRSDGALKNGIVTQDSLAPGLFTALTASFQASIAADAAAANTAKIAAQAANTDAQAAKTAAQASAASAATSAATVAGGAGTALAQAIAAADAITDAATVVANAATASSNAQNNAEGARDEAELYMQAAFAWADHLPGTIPPDVLTLTGVTGDHWSARFWANYANNLVTGLQPEIDNVELLIADFSKKYLGPKALAPSTDNSGNPLVAGALYWNTVSSAFFVWTGSSWTAFGGGGGSVANGANTGGGAEIWRDLVGGVLRFRTIRHSTEFTVTQSADEVAVSISTVNWAKIASKPTTTAGFGITDVYTKTEIDLQQAAQDAQIAARPTATTVNGQLAALDTALSGDIDAEILARTNADTDLQGQINNRVVRTWASGSAIIPAGTTAQRDGSPGVGYLRFNSSLTQFEGWNGTEWAPVGGGGALIADTPPTTNLRAGNLWFSSALGILFVYYDDGNSAQWVSTSPAYDPALFLQAGNNLSDLTNADTALTNLGFGAYGKTLRTMADAAAARASLGQEWVTIFDQTVSGAAIGLFDVNLQGYTTLRWRMDWIFNPAMADSGFGVRNSVDGGATYRAGGSDYLYVISYTDIPLGYDVASAALNSIGTLTNTFDNAAGTTVPIVMNGNIHAGATSRRFAMDARFYGDGPASARLGSAHTRSQANGKSTHLRFMSDLGVNSFDIGTRLIVEAAV